MNCLWDSRNRKKESQNLVALSSRLCFSQHILHQAFDHGWTNTILHPGLLHKDLQLCLHAPDIQSFCIATEPDGTVNKLHEPEIIDSETTSAGKNNKNTVYRDMLCMCSCQSQAWDHLRPIDSCTGESPMCVQGFAWTVLEQREIEIQSGYLQQMTNLSANNGCWTIMRVYSMQKCSNCARSGPFKTNQSMAVTNRNWHTSKTLQQQQLRQQLLPMWDPWCADLPCYNIATGGSWNKRKLFADYRSDLKHQKWSSMSNCFAWCRTTQCQFHRFAMSKLTIVLSTYWGACTSDSTHHALNSTTVSHAWSSNPHVS